MAIDFDRLTKMFDDALARETPESLREKIFGPSDRIHQSLQSEQTTISAIIERNTADEISTLFRAATRFGKELVPEDRYFHTELYQYFGYEFKIVYGQGAMLFIYHNGKTVWFNE